MHGSRRQLQLSFSPAKVQPISLLPALHALSFSELTGPRLRHSRHDASKSANLVAYTSHMLLKSPYLYWMHGGALLSHHTRGSKSLLLPLIILTSYALDALDIQGTTTFRVQGCNLCVMADGSATLLVHWNVVCASLSSNKLQSIYHNGSWADHCVHICDWLRNVSTRVERSNKSKSTYQHLFKDHTLFLCGAVLH
jgi:hypothetical protein